jgi:hypothetical protein
MLVNSDRLLLARLPTNVTSWGMISSSFTLDLDPFFTAMQSAAYAAEGLR